MTLLRYGQQAPPVCRCGRQGGTCAACMEADRLAAQIKQRLSDRRLRKLKFGPAAEGEDEFAGFRGEE